MPTYQVVTPTGVTTRPCPATLPEPGQTYVVQRPFITRGGRTYFARQELTLLERTEEAPHGYASSLGNWRVQCPYETSSVWSGIEGMIAERTLNPALPVESTDADTLEEIRSILTSYYEEIVGSSSGSYGDGSIQAQVYGLVHSHLSIRENFRSIYGEYQDARKKGYEDGMRMGGKAADSQYVSLKDLRKMSLGEISNLLMDD